MVVPYQHLSSRLLSDLFSSVMWRDLGTDRKGHSAAGDPAYIARFENVRLRSSLRVKAAGVEGLPLFSRPWVK